VRRLRNTLFFNVSFVGSEVLAEELEGIGATIILGNTFHLMLRPGTDVIRAHGGLHGFGAQAYQPHGICELDGTRTHERGVFTQTVTSHQRRSGAAPALPQAICGHASRKHHGLGIHGQIESFGRTIAHHGPQILTQGL
jgi:hypothetical protein